MAERTDPVVVTVLEIAGAVAYGYTPRLGLPLVGFVLGWAWGMVGTLFPLRRRLGG